MKRAYVTVDVFTDRKFGGNPLAVVLDAEGLDTAHMQAIAAEFNYAETTFVLPPKDAKHTAQVRIFTPKAEMPFAGHPNIGTAFVLARRDKRIGDKIVFEETAGLVAIDVTRRNGEVVATRLAAPQPFTLGETIDRSVVAGAAGLETEDIVGHPIVASTGVKLVFAEVASRAALKRATCRSDVFMKHLPMDRIVGVHLYVPAREHGVEVQTRMFAPLFGVPEDPATGGANVTLAGLLALARPEQDLAFKVTIGQGFDMGRPSILEGAADKKAGKVVATYIGGRSVPVMQGEIELD